MASPWQGCDPMKAKFIFVGLDANYPEDVETSLPEAFNYLHDGVTFGMYQQETCRWKADGVVFNNGKAVHERNCQRIEPREGQPLIWTEMLPHSLEVRTALAALTKNLKLL